MRKGSLMTVVGTLVGVLLLVAAGWFAAKLTRPQQPAPVQDNATVASPAPAVIDKAYMEALLYKERFKAMMLDEGAPPVYFSFTKGGEPLKVGKCPEDGLIIDMPCAYVEGPRLVAFDSGSNSAVVETAYNYGGTGRITTIYLMTVSEGKVTISDPNPLGDRVQIDSATLEGDKLTMKMTVHGPTDGMCCPTKKTTWRLRFDGKQFVKAKK